MIHHQPQNEAAGIDNNDALVLLDTGCDLSLEMAQGLNHAGGEIWSRLATDPNANYGVEASLAVGPLEGTQAVVAPSLGQEAYALNT